VSFEASLVNTQLAAIDADARKLSQVVRNLLSNALKFSPRGSAIQVNVMVMAAEGSDANHRLRMDVVDFGPGISKVRVVLYIYDHLSSLKTLHI
jgi:signal transduction histidine kinase